MEKQRESFRPIVREETETEPNTETEREFLDR